MDLNQLPIELYDRICYHLNDRSFLNLSLTCKKLSKLICRFRFTGHYSLETILEHPMYTFLNIKISHDNYLELLSIYNNVINLTIDINGTETLPNLNAFINLRRLTIISSNRLSINLNCHCRHLTILEIYCSIIDEFKFTCHPGNLALETLIIHGGNTIPLDLPVKHLYLKSYEVDRFRFNSPIDDLNFGSEFETLSIQGIFNQSVDNLPKTLRKLELFGSFDQPIDYLPSGLRSLSIHGQFVHDIYYLPPGLKSLSIKGHFNNHVMNLPLGLEHLELLGYFNNPIDLLPVGLKTLKLGPDFNYPIDNLPDSLETLELGEKFNQPINWLPNKLLHLKLGRNFNHPIDNLPLSLRQLKLGEKFNQSLTALSYLNLDTLELASNSDINQLKDCRTLTKVKCLDMNNFTQLKLHIKNLPFEIEHQNTKIFHLSLFQEILIYSGFLTLVILLSFII